MRRLTLLLPCLLLAACSVQQSSISIPGLVLPATGMSTLNLAVNVGIVTIAPSSDDKVHVAVSLKPSSSFFGLFTNGNSLDAVHQAVINHALSDGVLTLGIQYPTNADTSGISEHWTIAVPAATHVTGHVSVGELNVNGISGGVDSNLNVGKVLLDVPGGSLKITVNVGKIQASVHSLNYSDVTLGASIGKTSLSVDGVAVGDLQKTGAGENLSYKGGGKDSVNLQVDTGKVQLALLTH